MNNYTLCQYTHYTLSQYYTHYNIHITHYYMHIIHITIDTLHIISIYTLQLHIMSILCTKYLLF